MYVLYLDELCASMSSAKSLVGSDEQGQNLSKYNEVIAKINNRLGPDYHYDRCAQSLM